MKNAVFLRKKYPRFIYQKYSYQLKGGELRTSFHFRIEPDIRFKSAITIKNVSSTALEKIGDRALNNFVFHLGLMEIPSYWKATASPEIMIRAGFLTKEQRDWWRDLIINAMGQFFYENKIDCRNADFLSVVSNPALDAPPLGIFGLDLREKFLIPMGGGKDSIVTLEKLKKREAQLACFLLNPQKIQRGVIEIAGIKDCVVAERKIDPRLLALNRQGYLNGHTPFTAVLSFLGVFCAAIFDYKNVVFSNEKSADEGNVDYLDGVINHQYAKSSDFENRFKGYCKKHLAPKMRCYSFLRKYTEAEISKMFSKYPQYFSIFSSCNVGLKTRERWCGNCPKCLFVYSTLYPYLTAKQLQGTFAKDMFMNKNLLQVMRDLLGRGKHKPFECVGTYKESQEALELCLVKAKTIGELPYLLEKYNEIR
ncbi:MAG: hypothetical protein HYT21_02250 [Candidatus Nealsonbacteria bacterium]|nr:hypothetical protein [Candidatus Nealsonbacteria bacterium]